MPESVACNLCGSRGVLASTCTAVGLVERVLISDWLVRSARISGQVVAYFTKPLSIPSSRAEAA